MDIFNEDGKSAEQQPANPTQGEQANQGEQTNFLDQLVGEGKKFKSVEDLAKSKIHSDEYIGRLETQMTELREDLNSKLNAQQVLDEIKKQGTAQAVEHSRENTTPALDADAVAELVRNQMTAMEATKTASANLTDAIDGLMKVAGSEDKSKEMVSAKAKELGVTPEFLKETAMKSPTAFLSLMGASNRTEAAPTGGMQNSSVNTATMSMNSSAPQAGTKEYFDALRKENPEAYFTPKVQQAIMEAARKGTYKID